PSRLSRLPDAADDTQRHLRDEIGIEVQLKKALIRRECYEMRAKPSERAVLVLTPAMPRGMVSARFRDECRHAAV
ncbi:MAG: hypothetical protein ACLQUT_00115, partial [Thermoleophilia bacterium]